MTNLELKTLLRALAKLHEKGLPDAAYEVIKATLEDFEVDKKPSSSAAKEQTKG